MICSVSFETDCGLADMQKLCGAALGCGHPAEESLRCKIPRSCVMAWRMPTSFQCLAPHHGVFLFQKDSVRRSPPIQKNNNKKLLLIYASPFYNRSRILQANRRNFHHIFQKSKTFQPCSPCMDDHRFHSNGRFSIGEYLRRKDVPSLHMQVVHDCPGATKAATSVHPPVGCSLS